MITPKTKSLHLIYLSLCLLLLLALHPTAVSGQQVILDSLNSRLANPTINGHDRAMTMARLSSVLSFDNLQEALQKNKMAIAYARQNKDQPAASFAYAQKVALLVKSGQADLAMKAADSAILLSKGAIDLIQGIAWFNKGFIQNIQNLPDEARESWEKALRLLNGIEGARYRANIYYLIYGIYAERNDVQQAIRYAKLSLEEALQSREPSIKVAAWQINGTLYLDQFNSSKDSTMLDSSVTAFKNAVAIFRQEQQRIKNPSIVVLSALNLADIYMDYYPPWYKDSILVNVNLSLRISKQTGNSTMEANCYEIISKLHLREGDLNSAKKALLQEKLISDSIQPPNFYQSMNLYQSLATISEKQGDLAQALAYYKAFLEFYKKEFNQRQYQNIQQLEAKYQNEKKDKALQLLVQKNKFQQRQYYLYIGLAFLACAGLLFLFLAYRFRLKYSLERERLKDEEAARLLAEQRLIQNQKQQLQKEVLAGSMQVEHKNELLQNLKEKLSTHADGSTVRQLERILHEERIIDEDFEQYRTGFKDIHPDFFDWLEAKAAENQGQKLTQLDFKYAAYIYMRLSSKQIAALLHVAPKSVRMAKYRLKQKLGIRKEEDMEETIAKWQKN